MAREGLQNLSLPSNKLTFLSPQIGGFGRDYDDLVGKIPSKYDLITILPLKYKITNLLLFLFNSLFSHRNSSSPLKFGFAIANTAHCLLK